MSISKRENMLRLYRQEGPLFLPLGEDIQAIRAMGQGLLCWVEGRPGQVDELDWFGQNWKFEEHIRAYNPDATNYIVKDVTKWREYMTIPDLDAIDWDAIFERDNITVDRENKLIVLRDPVGIWEQAFSSIEVTELMTGLLVEPEAMYDFFGAMADHKIKMHNIYIDRYKPDVLAFHDDYGHGHGLFMSPSTWRELIKPHLQRIIDNAHSKGLMYEHHCCGYMVPLVEEIAEMGAASWNSVHHCNDPIKCKEMFGDKIAFAGGTMDSWTMDAPSTTEEQIREHVRYMTSKMLPGNIYVSCGFSSNPDRAPIFADELLKSGQQYYPEMRPV